MKRAQKKNLLNERLQAVLAYEDVVAGKHPSFKRVSELANEYGFSRKWLWELNRRFVESGRDPESLLLKARGPKRPWNRPPQSVERLVVKIHRKLGISFLELHLFLLEQGIDVSPSSIRNVLKRYPYHRNGGKLHVPQEKEKPGDLGYIAVKKISSVSAENPRKKYYEAALMDRCSRVVYRERLANKKARTCARFLHNALLNFRKKYAIQFRAILSDNSKAFTTHLQGGRGNHAFEKALEKYGIVHHYSRPYGPQFNGKFEGFWEIWRKECWKATVYKSWYDYDKKAEALLYNYNYMRRHVGLNSKSPVQKPETIQMLRETSSSGDSRRGSNCGKGQLQSAN